MEYDVIVVGGGLGGLTAGALLAKRGKKVCLLEQHYVPGGCATTFKRKGLTIEVGLHEMDGLDSDDIKVKIFEELGVFDHVEFIRLPEFYRFVHNDRDITIPHDFDEASKRLCEAFPQEVDAIQSFLKKIKAITSELNRLPMEPWKLLLLLPFFPFLYPNIIFNRNKTVGDFIDELTSNEELKMLLLANIGYYHDDPHSLSLFFFAAAQGSYFTGGGHYIKGGSQKLSDYLASVITDNGGEVLLSARVSEIIVEDDRATGVRFSMLRGKEKGIEKELFGKGIIANAPIPHVVNNFLKNYHSPAFDKHREKINALEPACSLFTIYLGFKRPLREIGHNNYNTIYYDSSVKSIHDFNKRTFLPGFFAFVDYSAIDSGLSNDERGVGAIVTLDYAEEWKGLSEEEYKEKKAKVVEHYLNKLEEYIPGIKDEIIYAEGATAKTIERFTLNPGGSVYGFAQTPKQAGMNRTQARSPLKGLFYSSAWGNPGGGFTGAILSGYFCAREMS